MTPDELQAGIASRLRLLTYLFCPDEEDEPSAVLERLRIENTSRGPDFESWKLFYRANSSLFIRVDRHDRGGVDELLHETLATRREPGLADIRARLAEVQDDVAFCLKAADVNSMGFPLALAAAATLVECYGGLIQSGTYAWMVPQGQEVRTLLEI